MGRVGHIDRARLVLTQKLCKSRGGGGVPIISLRGVNFGCWSHLGGSGQNAMISYTVYSREGLL